MIIVLTAVTVFLVIRFCVTLFNFISKPKLTKTFRRYNELVSILIPARNEGDNILPILESIKSQDYENYEVIILDDGSTDNTFALATAFAQDDKRFTVVAGEPLPKNWLGKNFACHQLSERANGEFLLFIDADQKLKNGLINNAIYRMKVFRLAVLSLFADQRMHSLGERLVVPLLNYILLTLLPLRLVSMTKWPAFSAASGQFMMFDATIYRRNQWHEQVKKDINEDVEIMKLLKSKGFKGDVLLANGFLECRMYTSYFDGLQGLSKNLLVEFGYSVIGLLVYLILIFFGYSILFMLPSYELLGVVVFLVVGMRYMVSSMSNQNILLNFLLHPLQMITIVLVSILSIHKYMTKSIQWKGRKILQ